MITWYAFVIIGIAIVGAVVCGLQGARGRGPNDYSMGATLIVGLLLVAQVVISIVAPFTGNSAEGDPLEFWMYLIVVLALPFGGGFWALVDRTKWANVVLSVLHLSVAVMMYRMLVIWGF